MTDLCPSCREPVDHPSGDGCAAMTKHQPHEYPSPEAIVRAALEKAAANVQDRAWPDGWNWTASVIADDIRFLASDPAEVAAIIKAAGERHD